jgi:hypothetical protein
MWRHFANFAVLLHARALTPSEVEGTIMWAKEYTEQKL